MKLFTFCSLVALCSQIFISGCTTTPSCRDNPRNMSCMSADQLQKELNQ